jgi:hypothetical protein
MFDRGDRNFENVARLGFLDCHGACDRMNPVGIHVDEVGDGGITPNLAIQ